MIDEFLTVPVALAVCALALVSYLVIPWRIVSLVGGFGFWRGRRRLPRWMR